MTQKNRLEGGLINRDNTRDFVFNGQTMQGFEGDTLASALLANDIRLVGRSFKYHRPRGVLSSGSEEPNAMVELRTGNRKVLQRQWYFVLRHGRVGRCQA